MMSSHHKLIAGRSQLGYVTPTTTKPRTGTVAVIEPTKPTQEKVYFGHNILWTPDSIVIYSYLN